MSLDGLRAWIGVVERKLTMRTRVFLVLVALAVGGAGASLYLAIDAQDQAVTQSDLDTVREEAAGGGASAEIAQLEAELAELRGEVEALGAGGAPAAPGGNGSRGGGGQTAPGGTQGSGSGGATPPGEAELKGLLDGAQGQQSK